MRITEMRVRTNNSQKQRAADARSQGLGSGSVVGEAGASRLSFPTSYCDFCFAPIPPGREHKCDDVVSPEYWLGLDFDSRGRAVVVPVPLRKAA